MALVSDELNFSIILIQKLNEESFSQENHGRTTIAMDIEIVNLHFVYKKT